MFLAEKGRRNNLATLTAQIASITEVKALRKSIIVGDNTVAKLQLLLKGRNAFTLQRNSNSNNNNNKREDISNNYKRALKLLKIIRN